MDLIATSAQERDQVAATEVDLRGDAVVLYINRSPFDRGPKSDAVRAVEYVMQMAKYTPMCERDLKQSRPTTPFFPLVTRMILELGRGLASLDHLARVQR